jgi:hypothetical protein
MSLSVANSWLYVFLACLHFLLSLAAYTNAVVAVARMCGFAVRRNVNRPYLATSFNEFLVRVYYYYIVTVQRFVFYPLWGKTRWISNRKLRIFAVYFLSIFLAGMVHTIVRARMEWVGEGLSAVLRNSLHRLPYFAGLGLASAVSALLPKIPVKYLRWPVRALLLMSYFVVYSLCYSLQLFPASATLVERFSAFLHLFGYN